ncbi:MAG: PAS domain S-box protein [Candidatus Omnitrophica bacterium]|nr:PAS domain S-box protein [Candidatus Omnitrophota bacterium]
MNSSARPSRTKKKAPLRILILENNEEDIMRIQDELRRGGFTFTFCRAVNDAEFRRCLEEGEYDAVFSAYRLNDLHGLDALRVVRTLRSGIPFIFVTTALGEDTAVDAMRRGATDYVRKDRIEKIGPALTRALNEVTLKEEKARAERMLRESYAQMEKRVIRRTEELSRSNEQLKKEIVERKKSQQQLEEEHQRLLSIFDSIQEIIYVSDPHTHEILYVNEFFRRQLGHDPTGKKCFTEFQNRNRVCDFCSNERILKNPGAPYQWEYHNSVLNKDFLVSDRIIEWPDGRQVRFELALDITPQKQVERQRLQLMKKLRAQTRRLEEQAEILERAHDAVIVRDMSDLIMFWNHGAELRYGWTKKEALGKHIHTLLHTEFAQPHEHIRERLLTHGEWEGELIQRKSDGTPVIMLSRWALTRNAAGEPLSVTEISADITRRKKAERALQEAHDKLEIEVAQRTADLVKLNRQLHAEVIDRKEAYELLERIFSTTNFLIAYMDIDFNFIRVNEAYAHADGKDPGFFVGKNHFELYPNEENAEIFRRVVETGEAYSAYARPFRYPGGKARSATYWDWNLHPVHDVSGQVEGVILSLVDVTERIKAQEALKKTQQQLSEAQRLSDLGTLAATVAHELRNPLGVIRTAAYNIRRKRENPSVDKHLVNIERKVGESNQIINNLLTYTRLKMPQYQKVDLSRLVDECAESIKARYRGQKIAFRIKTQKRARHVLIDADPHQLREVLNNIFLNAWQAVEPVRGKITVEIAMDELEHVVLQVEDNGEGIAQEDLENVFEPFFTTRSKGTGLGLSICKELINLHRGSVHVQSARGKGTTVTMVLPREKKNEPVENE